MTGLAVALLLAATGAVLSLPRTARADNTAKATAPSAVSGGPSRATPSKARGLAGGSLRGRRRDVDLHELPLFVHQLAGLLRAGRPPHLLWADMERVYFNGQSVFATEALPIIATARRAAELGLSVPDALRQATVSQSGPSNGASSRVHVDRLWVDLAGCLVVAERSGAPLAGILEHYATHLDAQLDGLSARDTALAGPRATVILLAWLPAVGLILAFALGVNPVEVLLGTPLGLLALVSGVFLMVASRVWSGSLVRRAAGGSP